MARQDNANGAANAALQRLRALHNDHLNGELTDDELARQALNVVQTLPPMRHLPGLVAARLGHICGRIEAATGHLVEV